MKNEKKLLLAAFFAAVLLSGASLRAEISKDFDSRIDLGLDILYQGDYDSALVIFDSFIRDHPENPAGYFFKAGLYQTRMSAHESDFWYGNFKEAVDSGIAQCNRRVALEPGDAWVYFIRGGCYSHIAAGEARQDKYLAAFRHGMKAAADFKKARNIDSTLYDAYIGIGSYHYFRTKATSFLKWLPFIGDNRDKGISEIKIAIEKGRYSRVMGQNALLWIYTDYGKEKKALELGHWLGKEFPSNPFFHWAVPEILWRQKRWQEAEKSYSQLLELIEINRPLNNYNRVIITYRLSKCLLETGKNEEAYLMAQRSVSYPLDKKSARRLVAERSQAQEVMARAGKKLKDKQ